MDRHQTDACRTISASAELLVIFVDLSAHLQRVKLKYQMWYITEYAKELHHVTNGGSSISTLGVSGVSEWGEGGAEAVTGKCCQSYVLICSF